MAKDTITVALNGDTITLQDFVTSISRFQTLVYELTSEIVPRTKVNWFLMQLETSSAIATWRGCAESGGEIESVEKVVDAYVDVGYSLKEGTPFPYSRKTYRAAKKMVSIVNGNITSVRFENSDDDVEVSQIKLAKGRKPTIPVSPRPAHVVFGAMRGRVQSVSNRGSLRFTLYDLVDDKAISCYLPPGSETIMRDAWGKIALVEGKIHRNEETGRASTIRDVSGVMVLPECKRGEWREAIGAAPGFLGTELPEDVVRRSRDVVWASTTSRNLPSVALLVQGP